MAALGTGYSMFDSIMIRPIPDPASGIPHPASFITHPSSSIQYHTSSILHHLHRSVFLSLRYLRILCLTSVLSFSVQAVYGQASIETAPNPRRFTVHAVEEQIQVDGVLDEPLWQIASSISLPYEWFPGDGVEPPVQTECLVTHDAHHLYVAFRALDPDPSSIRAHLMDRDDIVPFVQDDHVGVLIDPFNDERRAFQLRVNPLGVQADAIFSELEGFEDFSWDIIWASAGLITGEGYVVEISIPFNQLRFEASSEPQTWGFEAFRSYPRTVRHRISSNHRDRNRSCILCQIDKLEGFASISPGRNIELGPTVTSIRTDVRPDPPAGAFDNGAVEVEPGLNARWGITPNMVLNATVNPDFSQVEADAAQLDVNNRFALFFEEKRPFFLEGADFFLTPLQAVFTRTVADPLGGAKITSKAGRNALGVFVTQDRVNSLILPSNQRSTPATIDDHVTGNVVRYRRDVGSGSTLGLLYTGRFGAGYDNQIAGLDGFVRISRTNTMQFQVLHSETNYPEKFALNRSQPGRRFGGNGGMVQFDHRSRRWTFSAGYEDLSDAFRADYGFIRRVDVRTGRFDLQRVFRGTADSWFSMINLGIQAERTGDQNGALTDQSVGVTALYLGPYQSVLNVELSANKERFVETTYDLNRASLFGSIQPSGKINVSLFTQVGDQIDFVNQRDGSEVLLMPTIGVKLGRSLSLNASNTLQVLEAAGRRLFTANIAQGAFQYHFNVRTFIRLILQYQIVDRNLSNYSPALQNAFSRRDQSLFTQLLFSYKINPQTVLFLGYSDNYAGAPSYELTQTGRTFFFKLGYALVM